MTPLQTNKASASSEHLPPVTAGRRRQATQSVPAPVRCGRGALTRCEVLPRSERPRQLSEAALLTDLWLVKKQDTVLTSHANN